MLSNRPLIFTDLDDTLFQTGRKMPKFAERHPASYDAEGNPSGYMSNVQKSFAEWLFANADVIPVTARSMEVCARVSLPFTHGAICSHGAIILGKDGVDESWSRTMARDLTRYQSLLPELSRRTLEVGKRLGFSLRGWVVQEEGMGCYVVTKHNDMTDYVLQALANEMSRLGLLDGFYIHRNGNNLAFLPSPLNKRHAVSELIRRDREINGERPILGLGDSLSDLPFMNECHWWATPAIGQIASHLEGK